MLLSKMISLQDKPVGPTDTFGTLGTSEKSTGIEETSKGDGRRGGLGGSGRGK